MAEAKRRKMDAYAMKRVAAGAHLPTPWFFEPAKRPDDRADYTAWASDDRSHYCVGTRRQRRLLPGYQRIEPTTAWIAVSSLSAMMMG